jgi:hypothetical protein
MSLDLLNILNTLNEFSEVLL